MPQTKASKRDNRTPLEKILQLKTKVEKLMFFNYYDGYTTEGNIGFQISDEKKPGSVKHRTGIFEIYTKSQFRSKGKKIAAIARECIAAGVVPSDELRPHFVLAEIQELIRENTEDSRTPAQKLAAITDEKERFIFFQYYDGYRTNGEIGFSERAGPPGSINHKRSFAQTLEDMPESRFRLKAKELAALAKEFLGCCVTPNPRLRPPSMQPRANQNQALLAEAARNGFTNYRVGQI